MAASGDVPAFPRGGKEILTSKEKKRIRQEAFKEAEADLVSTKATVNRQKRQRRNQQHAGDQDVLAFARHASEVQNIKYVELLKFKAINVGAKVWGVVAGIHAKELIVVLPDGLRAFVPAEEASDALAGQSERLVSAAGVATIDVALPSLQALFHVGQLISGVVIKLEEAQEGTKSSVKKRIILSLRVTRVNQGLSRISLMPGMCLSACVKDVEDHGYLLSVGIKGSAAFLEQGDGIESPEAVPMPQGRLLPVVIVNASDTRLLHVSANPKQVASCVGKEDFNLTIGTLQPGSLVKAKIVKILDDGLVLSFLTYFSGTVNSFHIPQVRGARKEWKDSFSEGQKLRARILFVDPASKKICLSLLPHLLTLKVPTLPSPGDLIEGAEVIRVDPAIGAILQLPTGLQAFCHISDVSDGRVAKLEKVLKVGQKETVRVIGSRFMDNLAVVSLKPSAIEQYLVAGLQPGQIVKGEVVLVDQNGMLVKLSKNTNAYVANEHMSDLGEKQGKIKYKVGSKVTGRILKVDLAKRRTTMSLQHSLVTSKTKPLSSLQDIQTGLKAHGIVNGFTSYGMFVHFYGDIRGLVHISEMDLEPGAQPSEAFKIGQVVKVRVIDFDPVTKRLQLSVAKKGKAPATGTSKVVPGEVLAGSVTSIKLQEDGTTSSYRIELERDGKAVGKGILEPAHLADHPSAIEAFQESLQVGSRIQIIQVLDESKGNGLFPLTCKTSLTLAELLPRTVEDLQEGQIVPGFVANITADAVFIRFLGGLTGRAGVAHLSDGFVGDPFTLFSVGQSVTAQVLQVNTEKGTFGLSLKRSAVGDLRPGFLGSLFHDLEVAYALKSAVEEAQGEALSDWSRFAVGGRVKGSVHERKDYGIICDLEDDPNLVGLIALHQVDDEPVIGAHIEALVLDTNKINGILDLTLKAQLCPGPSAVKRSTETTAIGNPLKVGSAVKGIIQIVRDEYSVVCLPDFDNKIGFVGLLDYNTRQTATRHALFSQANFTISQLPSKYTGNRLILAEAGGPLKASRKKAAGAYSVKASRLNPGELVQGEVAEVQPLGLLVVLNSGQRGIVHISQITDESAPKSNPLEQFKEGQSLKAIVLGRSEAVSRFKARDLYDLSIKPSVVQGTKRAGKYIEQQSTSLADLSQGSTCQGFIAGVNPEYLLVAISHTLTGRVSALDASRDPEQLANLFEAFHVGQPCTCTVIKVDQSARKLDLAFPGDSVEGTVSSLEAAKAQTGSILIGRVVSTSGHGVRINLGPNTFGSATLHDLHDSWVSNAVDSINTGDFVRCRVLSNAAVENLEAATSHSAQETADSSARMPMQSVLALSLKPSLGGRVAGQVKPVVLPHPPNTADLRPGAEVCGYVKTVSKAGVFMALCPGVDARIKLMNLAGHFVEDPAAAFPIGLCVRGRLLSTDPKLEMTLRTDDQKSAGYEGLKVGDVVEGRVVRVKDFGVFVQLDGKPVTGLVHKSEISDQFVKNMSGLFTRLQSVKAMVIDVDPASRKLKLSMKPSHFAASEVAEPSDADEIEPDLDEEMLDAMPNDSDSDSDWRAAGVLEAEESGRESDSEDIDINLRPEADPVNGMRIPDSELQSSGQDEDDEGVSSSEPESMERDPQANAAEIPGSGRVGWGKDEAVLPVPKVTDAAEEPDEERRSSKRKLKQQKKAEEDSIRKAEVARLQGSKPSSAADFERELMGAPNSSLLWIQYLAFNVSLGEIAKARAVAEQALQRIAYREEEEKFNIWKARLNLEMHYGEPPEEAVTKVFQRALALTNQKKLYMSLLDLAKQAGKEDLLQQTYKAVNRKFAASAKFWLHQLHHAQAQNDAAYVAAVMDRAIKSTPARKHVKILRQAALQDFKMGSAERARGTFESLLRNYPKRMDLWSIYIDQEIKQGDKARIRSLFARATTLQIPAKKMKFLFKRQLEYEKQYGTPKSVEDVKMAARRFVEENLQA